MVLEREDKEELKMLRDVWNKSKEHLTEEGKERLIALLLIERYNS